MGHVVVVALKRLNEIGFLKRIPGRFQGRLGDGFPGKMKIFCGEVFMVGEDHRLLDPVVKFPYVPLPLLKGHRFLRFLGESLDRSSVVLIGAREEIVCQ